MIVFPGGGYAVKAMHEAEPIALELNAQGFSAFVLDYRVFPFHYPCPQLDAQRAVRFVRAHAADYGVRPDAIAVLGFSAGGHLAACTGVFHDGGNPDSADPVERHSSRPDAMVLCYPVIDMQAQIAHSGSANNLLGEDADAGQRAQLSPNRHVQADTSPAFLWHTADDEVVPVAHSLDMFAALRANGVPAELHVYKRGAHGLALTGYGSINTWPALCASFLRSLYF